MQWKTKLKNKKAVENLCSSDTISKVETKSSHSNQSGKCPKPTSTSSGIPYEKVFKISSLGSIVGFVITREIEDMIPRLEYSDTCKVCKAARAAERLKYHQVLRLTLIGFALSPPIPANNYCTLSTLTLFDT